MHIFEKMWIYKLWYQNMNDMNTNNILYYI